MPPRFIVAVVSLVFISCTSHADSWPNWRGPHGNGVAEGTGYAVSWGPNSNILWKVELPGPGGSTPAIWGDNIIVTCASGAGDGENNLVICFSRDGRTRWQRPLGRERQGKHKKGSGSNPSPVTDGTHVYCYFKSGDLACLDFDGQLVWHRNLQKEFAEDTLWWDLGTSPVLTDDAVVVACVQSGPSYLVALDKRSGDVLWKQDRMLGAPEEANQTYSTPIVTGAGSSQKLIVLGADHVTCHSANTGAELWRVGGMNPKGDQYFRSIASPVLSDEMVLAPYARGGTLTAIRMGGRGDITDSHVAWTINGPSSDVPTPAAKNGTAYVLTDKGTIAALESETGKIIWQGSLPKNRNAYSASPVLADGRLYAVREDGTAFVLRTDEFQVISKNELDDRVVATPVFADGKIFLRAATHLYCIGH